MSIFLSLSVASWITSSSYLFALVMDELTRTIQDEVPWGMLFANDIVLVDETKRGVDVKLKF